MKLASVVLLVMISTQKQFQNLALQDEQNNELKAWINIKYTIIFLSLRSIFRLV